jgi:Ca2+-binding RTX toxin-like protein
MTNGLLVKNGTLDIHGIPIENNFFKESFSRNLNTLGGDPTLTGWQVLFGQFFDHGLDFIGKGGNTINGKSSKVYIPLATDDPFYRAPGTNGPSDPGYTKLSISRATVDNPDAAGADGMFHTADDIQSSGADGIYGINPTTGLNDDIIGPTNPNYVNHTSPYIDQSQTYGSNDTVTSLLREWVLDPTTGNYAPGMKLFDGNTLTHAWTQENPDGSFTTTQKTLPTLNELRAYLLATGRDDLTWGDINDLRVRDASGDVLDLDPVTGGIQSKSSGHTLIADFLPRLDAAHIDAAGLTAMATLFPSYSGTIADYVDVNSGQPTTLGINNPDILNELLLRSIGDHYVAGDGRANENFGLTAIHHVWHENHNWQIDNLILNISQQAVGDRNNWQVKVSDGIGGFYTNASGDYVTAASGPVSWNQEKLFQAATLINQTEYQHVAIDQYARGISPNIPLFVAYDSGVNSDVTLDYSQVAFRFGHSQLRETVDTLDPNGSLTGAITRYALEQAFLNPEGFAKVGPTAIAQGMTRQFSNEIDEIVTPALQQKLLGQPQDLAAINIARGRDLGMPTLNNLRRQLSGGLTTELSDLQQKLDLNPDDTTLRSNIDKTIALQAGLQAYTSWSDFGNNLLHPEALVNFIAAYSFDGNLAAAELVVKLVNDPNYTLTPSELAELQAADPSRSLEWASDAAIAAATFVGAGIDGNKGFESIDAWNGGLAEKHVFLGQLGSTFDAIFADQMTRLINGDRFYYFWRLQLGLPIFTELSSAVTTEQFKDVIERTTGAKHLVGDVFFAADSYVELGEQPVNTTSTGAARDHKYGDLVGVGVVGGVYSTFGASEVLNGRVTQIGTDKYIIDNRPDIGVNPDGTATRGFNAHEVIGGTAFKDFIDAGDGDDTIYGDNGDDTLLGNAGADHIYGELGNDVIYGGSLPDFLDGGLGNDEIHGGDDADVIIGAEGNDKLFGENFTDELHGNAGDDYIDGGLDADFIFAGEGQDVVVGGEGLDTTFGEWGDDRMFAGAGPDQLFGGYGDDILNGGAGGQNQNLNVDECLGEFGFNIVSFSDITTPLNTAADLNFQNVNLGSSTPFGQLWVDIQGIEGTGKADIIRGDANDNWLIGGGGNDTLTGGAGDDIIVGDSSLLSKLNDLTFANGGAKHFQDLQTSLPNFRFGDTVILGTAGVTYVQQTVLGNDTVIYNGARANFDITLIPDASGIVLKIKDLTLAETGANGDIVMGIETFKFANVTYALTDIVALAPSITSISNDTGTSATDGITNDNTLILTGKAFANSTIEVFRTGIAAPIGSVTASNTGDWSIDYTATSLADGPYTFTAKAAIAGFVSPLSTPFNVTVDTTGAAAPTLVLVIDSGLVGDTITNSGLVNVTGLELGTSWQYSTDSGINWVVGVGSSFTLTGDGAKSVIVRQTDVAGNVSATSAALNFTLDSVAIAPTLALANDSGISSTDRITKNGVVNITGLEAGATWQYSTNNGAVWATGVGSNFTLTGDGAKSVIVRQTDVAGNTSASSAAFTFTLDTVAPTLAKTASTTTMTLDTGVSATDFITNNGAAGRVYNGTFSANLSAGNVNPANNEGILVSTDGGTTWSAATITSNISPRGWTFTDNTVHTSNWTVQTRVVDAAGNGTGAITTRNVTLDTQISAASALTLDLLAAKDSGISSTDNITNIAASSLAVTFDATKATAGDVIQVRRGATVLSSTTLNAVQAAAGTFTVNASLLNGSNSLSVVHNDSAGNSVTSATTLDITLDTTAPAAAGLGGYTATSLVGTAEPNSSLRFSTSASAPLAASFAGTPATANAIGGGFTIDTSGLAGSTGGTSYYLYAQDVAGNLSPASTQRVVAGTGGDDTFVNVGGNGSDLLIGGAGTDIAQYGVTGGTNLTGSIPSTTGNFNIRTSNIDVLTGIETLNFTGTGYVATTPTTTTTISTVLKTPISQNALGNNAISEFTGVYNEVSGIFTFGVAGNASNNALLVAFDTTSGLGTNYETFLLLGKTTFGGSVALTGGTVTLSGL